MIAQVLLASSAIILLSFVSEDAATISSALTIFGGPISWPTGFAACFLGIWLGDIGLYSLARCGGKAILHSRWLRLFADPATMMRCERTFARNGNAALLASRFVPGTRLPTYFAAGLFAMPLKRFAFITALGALVWISGIFALTKIFGAQALSWFAAAQSRIVPIVATLLLIAGLSIVTRRILASPRIRRWKRWEFWPAWLFYLPVAFYYIILSVRYRSFTLPTAANPGIPSGGFVGESKVEILQQLERADSESVADGYLVEGWTATDRLLCIDDLCRSESISFPFVLKPDIGQRGNGVRLIRSMPEAMSYLEQVDAPVVLQRYASARHEAGIFYFRLPGESRGQIFSITEKIFPFVEGDGKQTIEQLIRADDRAALIADTYLQRFDSRRAEILPRGERLRLVESGNHAQGCIFRDGGHLWSEQLEEQIDALSQRVPGFYFGRFDIRYHNESELRAGRDFKIVELNGAASEATSIYDARYSLSHAYKVLFRQWRLVFEIGAMNRARGRATPLSLVSLWQEWRRYASAAACYPVAS